MIILYVQLFKTLKNSSVDHNDPYIDKRIKISSITGEFPYSLSGGCRGLESRENILI